MAHRQAQERNRRLRKLYRKTKHSYGSGAWFDEEADRLKRYYRPRCWKYWRKQANKRWRHYKGDPLQHGGHKKVSEVAWIVW